MKKSISLLIILYVIIMSFGFNVSASEEVRKDIQIQYFGIDSCSNCQAVKSFFKTYEKELQDEVAGSPYFDNVEIVLNDTAKGSVIQLHNSYSSAYNVPVEYINVTPTVFVGESYFIGVKEITEDMPKLITEYLNGTKEFKEITVVNLSSEDIKEIQEGKFDTFSPFTVVFAGFLDGFNPCAIAMLLFFITFISVGDKGNKSVLYTGGSYILGTFVAYFGIGLGLFKFADLFKEAKSVMIGIYGFTIIISIFLFIQNAIEFKELKNGNLDKVKLQLPKRIKHVIHDFLRKNSSSKAVVVSAFFSGVVVSFLEFFCTGQIYLPTIVYMLGSGNSTGTAATYLFLYNLAFVLPLIVICIAIYIGKQVMEVSQLLLSKMHIIKLIVSIFFFVIAILMIFQLKKII